MHPEIEQVGPGTCPNCGMALEPKTSSADEPEDDAELRDMTRRFWVALALSVPVLLLAMLPMVGVPVDRWLGARRIAVAAIRARHAGGAVGRLAVLRPRRGGRSSRCNLNMFTLIALGDRRGVCLQRGRGARSGLIPEAFSQHGHVEVYFEAAAVITALVLLGQVLELRARRRTGSAIRELLSLAPPTARVVRDGHEHEVPLDEVQDGRHAARSPRRKDSGRRRNHRGREHGRRVDDHRRAAAGRESGRATAVIGGTVNQTGSFLMRGRARRRGHGAGADRRHGGRAPSGAGRRSSGWPTWWPATSCRPWCWRRW